MPSIITHGSFGQDVYAQLEDLIGPSLDCQQAFLLGNQGPDPFFYAVLHPRYRSVNRMGTDMHRADPARLMYALKRSLDTIPPDTRNVGEAYATGFLCHYLLDSTEHPFIYSMEKAFTHAGVPGLTPSDDVEVHATIETEIDEVVLYARTGETIESHRPSAEFLACNDCVLNVIDRMFMSVILDVFGTAVSPHFFSTCVKTFRVIQDLFYSPTGTKRLVLADIERFVRPHSFYASMSHENVKRSESGFENNEHLTWTHPGFGTRHNESFADLYARALERAIQELPAFMDPGFDLKAANKLTNGIDFNGNPAMLRYDSPGYGKPEVA